MSDSEPLAVSVIDVPFTCPPVGSESVPPVVIDTAALGLSMSTSSNAPAFTKEKLPMSLAVRLSMAFNELVRSAVPALLTVNAAATIGWV